MLNISNERLMFGVRGKKDGGCVECGGSEEMEGQFSLKMDFSYPPREVYFQA